MDVRVMCKCCSSVFRCDLNRIWSRSSEKNVNVFCSLFFSSAAQMIWYLMTGVLLIMNCKDVEGSSFGLFEAPPWHLPGGIEEKYDKHQSGRCLQAEIWNHEYKPVVQPTLLYFSEIRNIMWRSLQSFSSQLWHFHCPSYTLWQRGDLNLPSQD
jgi:hypothetical protein